MTGEEGAALRAERDALREAANAVIAESKTMSMTMRRRALRNQQSPWRMT
jgi:hypothetical protein